MKCYQPRSARTRPGTSDADRLWPRVAVTSAGCWEYGGPRRPEGYGKVYRRGGQTLAHRLAWELTHGPVPDGLCVCHKCDNPPCCNPEHLFLGTRADNNRDANQKGRLRTPEARFGEKHHNATVPDSVRSAMRSMRAKGMSQRAIAEHFGVCARSAVGRIVSGALPRHARGGVMTGRFVDACARVSREPFQLVQFLDHRTRQPSRSCVVVVDEAGAMTPLVSCPFCGVTHEVTR